MNVFCLPLQEVVRENVNVQSSSMFNEPQIIDFRPYLGGFTKNPPSDLQVMLSRVTNHLRLLAKSQIKINPIPHI